MFGPASNASASASVSEREPLLRHEQIGDRTSSIEASISDAIPPPTASSHANDERTDRVHDAQSISVSDKLRILAVLFVWLISGMNLTVVGVSV